MRGISLFRPARFRRTPSMVVLPKSANRRAPSHLFPAFAAILLITFANSVFCVEPPASPDKNAQGSGTNRFWSLQPIRATAPPTPKNKTRVKNPIDAFVLSKIEQAKLIPPPRASKLTLLRRASFDLTGLPPTPDAIDAFLKDKSPDAYAKLIDRLLDSPRYGERWGRHWLDVVRYADTGGFEQDLAYQGAWRYRDYVIRAFNSNKPFNRFIQEQVAGDEMFTGDDEAAGATGLYAIGPVLNESAMISNQLENEWLTDAADTTGAAFLGITLGCARCHNHKYDPIKQTDYYAMQAVFAASDRPYPLKTREQRIKALNGLVAEKPLPKELANDPRCTLKTEKEAGTRLFHPAAPMEVHLLHRGEISKPREVVGPGVPAALVLEPGNSDFSSVPPGERRAALRNPELPPGSPFPSFSLASDENLHRRQLLRRAERENLGL